MFSINQGTLYIYYLLEETSFLFKQLVDSSVDHGEVVPYPHHLMCVCITENGTPIATLIFTTDLNSPRT